MSLCEVLKLVWKIPYYFLKFAYKILLRGDEYHRFMLAEMISRVIYRRYRFSEFGRLWLYDDEFIQCYEKFEKNGNFHSLDRKYTLEQLIQLTLPLEGDTVECGAYKGTSSYLICRRIMGLEKSHHIFDSFEGLSEPMAVDGSYWEKGNLSSGENLIRENLKCFSFVKYHKGWIPKKFHEVVGLKFCFVHLDVDLYQPTLDSLIFFYPNMVAGGIIICDDYAFLSCPGAKKAMDSYFSDKPEVIISLPTGQGFIIKQSL